MEAKGLALIVRSLGSFVSKNSSTILTTFAVGGVFSTTLLAMRATPMALLLIEEERYNREKGKDNILDDPVTKWDVIKLTWKLYIPAALTGLATVGCIIGANHISLRRNAALAGLYTLTETAFKEYKSKVIETVGKNKELQIRDDVAADKIKNNPASQNEIILTGKGDVLCYDSLSGRYFKSDIEKIRKAINDLNYLLRDEMFITLNELYDKLGLTGVELGKDMGWDIDRGQIEVTFSYSGSEDGTPCLVLNYDLAPKFMR